MNIFSITRNIISLGTVSGSWEREIIQLAYQCVPPRYCHLCQNKLTLHGAPGGWCQGMELAGTCRLVLGPGCSQGHLFHMCLHSTLEWQFLLFAWGEEGHHLRGTFGIFRPEHFALPFSYSERLNVGLPCGLTENDLRRSVPKNTDFLFCLFLLEIPCRGDGEVWC